MQGSPPTSSPLCSNQSTEMYSYAVWMPEYGPVNNTCAQRPSALVGNCMGAGADVGAGSSVTHASEHLKVATLDGMFRASFGGRAYHCVIMCV